MSGDDLTGGSQRFCEDCASESMRRYTVNALGGKECESCGDKISFGNRAYYRASGR